jgi:hypothetical protein
VKDLFWMFFAFAWYALPAGMLLAGSPPPPQAPRPPQAPELPMPKETHRANVPPACCCAVGDACGCAPGHCHCASAQWFETPGTNGDQFGLFKGSKQVGSWRRSDGVFLPLLGDDWGQPCKCPKTPPGRGSVAPTQSVPQFLPQSFRPAGRSGGC